VKTAAEAASTPTQAKVFVVEDDLSMRNALSSLTRSVDLAVQTFATAADFLRHRRVDEPACLVLDVRLPGLSGLDLQAELTKANDPIPIIFITSHADVPMSVRAMKAGAVEFLTKPFRDQDLLDAIQHAIKRAEEAYVQRTKRAQLHARYELLTPREREVMSLVVRGLLNKQSAAQLGTSEVTVKIQRAHVMRKMEAESVIDLAKMSGELGLSK
jgi:FixJ family two-component response regulator